MAANITLYKPKRTDDDGRERGPDSGFPVWLSREARSELPAALLQLLKERGRRFEKGMLPARRGGWHRVAKGCFRNAYLNASTDPCRYLYCEGFVLGKSGPILHAWFVESGRPDVALDSTPNHEDETLYFGIAIPSKHICEAVLAERAFDSMLKYWARRGIPAELLGG